MTDAILDDSLLSDLSPEQKRQIPILIDEIRRDRERKEREADNGSWI